MVKVPHGPSKGIGNSGARKGLLFGAKSLRQPAARICLTLLSTARKVKLVRTHRLSHQTMTR